MELQANFTFSIHYRRFNSVEDLPQKYPKTTHFLIELLLNWHVVRSIFYMVRVVKFAYVINVTHRQMISKTELYLSGKFGPLLSLANLADLLDRSVDGLRFSLSQDGEMAAKFNPAGKKSVGASISDLRSSLKCLMKKIEGAQFE